MVGVNFNHITDFFFLDICKKILLLAVAQTALGADGCVRSNALTSYCACFLVTLRRTPLCHSVCLELYSAVSWWFSCWPTAAVNVDVTIKKYWGPTEKWSSLSCRIWFVKLALVDTMCAFSVALVFMCVENSLTCRLVIGCPPVLATAFTLLFFSLQALFNLV